MFRGQAEPEIQTAMEAHRSGKFQRSRNQWGRFKSKLRPRMMLVDIRGNGNVQTIAPIRVEKLRGRLRMDGWKFRESSGERKTSKISRHKVSRDTKAQN